MLNPPLQVMMLRTKGDLKKGGTYYVNYVTPLGLHMVSVPAGNGIGNPCSFDDVTADVPMIAANDDGKK